MRIRSIAKDVFTVLGWYNPCQDKLAIGPLRQDDTFLVSYPRSGNTWMRFMIANILLSGEHVTPEDVNKVVPDIHKATPEICSLNSPRIIKTHKAEFECYPKWIYVVRDGRDAMVSFYYYSLANKRFSGTFTEFLSSRRPRIFNQWTWAEHVQTALEWMEKGPEKGLLLRYEDMVEDPETELEKAVKFAGIAATSNAIARAVDSTRFSKLQQQEAQNGAVSDRNQRFFRRGGVGEWRQLFSDKDLGSFEAGAKDVLERLRYS